jgi:hypothetical protein
VLFAESGGGIETGTVQGNLEFMIPRRLAVARDAAHRKKAGMETEQDPKNIQRGTKFEWIFTDDQSIIDGCGSTNQEHGGMGQRKDAIDRARGCTDLLAFAI